MLSNNLGLLIICLKEHHFNLLICASIEISCLIWSSIHLFVCLAVHRILKSSTAPKFKDLSAPPILPLHCPAFTSIKVTENTIFWTILILVLKDMLVLLKIFFPWVLHFTLDYNVFLDCWISSLFYCWLLFQGGKSCGHCIFTLKI